MNNPDYDDRDSLGFFQQRPREGREVPEECMDSVHATNAFLDQAIPDDAGNPDITAAEPAQSCSGWRSRTGTTRAQPEPSL